jgi:hypothetical protein
LGNYAGLHEIPTRHVNIMKLDPSAAASPPDVRYRFENKD